MSSYNAEKTLRAHLDLIAEAGEYAAFFRKNTNGAWILADSATKDAAQALLDARVAEGVTIIGPEESNGEGPSDFEGYTAIHFDDSIVEVDVSYRTWFIKDEKYYKADNGNSNTLSEVTDPAEIAVLLEACGYLVDEE